MPSLEVPGAHLHYQAVGEGPMLLCIHGGNGSGEIWRAFSGELQDRFMVVFYDRMFSSVSPGGMIQ
jgi:pimeloyl-ACP methyl ester carboxylesterase